ncbi:MAG TPA: glycosyltransferase [Thermodesulfobacteriota bacterium]|nr:glycosyltransferase [Thermodesulfobacteriota bacterium]
MPELAVWPLFERAVTGFSEFVLGYFVVLHAIYLLMWGLSLRTVLGYLRRRRFRDNLLLYRSRLTPPVSVIVPAFNEAANIVASVRALTRLQYPEYEIIVVNDGSTDDTLERLAAAFDLKPVTLPVKRELLTKPVRGLYRSAGPIPLLVVDKVNGGKADALNAGINVARYPLFCATDADSILEDDALLKVVAPFLEHPDEMMAVGGIVRIANGCTVVDGRVARAGLPREPLVMFQIVEYLRTFLTGRLGWSALRSLLIISGAFGLFRKAAVVAAGGYRTGTVGEDMELVVRMHRTLREQRIPYRMVFIPDPICWTEAPVTLAALRRQRNRWQRGLMESLVAHRRMFLNPRYGVIGLFAMPYFVLFEMLGPAVELAGYAVVAAAAATGLLDRGFMLLFLAVAFLTGVFLSVGSVLLEELSFHRYPGLREVVRILAFSLLEPLCYKQLMAYWRTLGILDYLRRRGDWGVQPRHGFLWREGPGLPGWRR